LFSGADIEEKVSGDLKADLRVLTERTERHATQLNSLETKMDVVSSQLARLLEATTSTKKSDNERHVRPHDEFS
jgi:hypothetical protein